MAFEHDRREQLEIHLDVEKPTVPAGTLLCSMDTAVRGLPVCILMTWLRCVGALQDRLLDYDDKVRVAVVKAICDLAKTDLKSIPTDLLRKVAERLRDKKVHGPGSDD